MWQKIKFFIAIVLPCCLLFSCNKQQGRTAIKHAFKTQMCLKSTPVKNQGASASCWIYAVLAMLETDRLEQGDSVNLSPAFLERALLQQRGLEHYLGANSAQLKMSGTMPQTFPLINQVGLVSYDSYPNDKGTNTPFLMQKVKKTAQQILAQKQGFSVLKERINSLLDAEMGAMPFWVFLYGMQYSPKQFANSIFQTEQYQSYTSFTHHPFNEKVILEIPDNTAQSAFYNVPIDTLMHIIDSSLANHRAVCWEGSINKGEFSFSQGIARLSKHHPTITQEERQRAFERLQTTDQHVMCIVGKAKSRTGKSYYIAKNSWGLNNPYGGFMYLSKDFIKLRTIAIMCQRQKNETINLNNN